MINLTQKYIGGLECFSENITEVKYRNNSNTLWKQNFPESFKKISSELKSVYEKKIPYYENNLVDIVYVLEKNQSENFAYM
jgi:hypothetical protein